MDAVPLEPSLTRSSYVDHDEFVREREAVLFPGWFCVGRAESVSEPGDYLTADVVGESVMVVRAADGTLAAFYNLCRHRGSRLVSRIASEPAAEPGRSGCFAGSIRCPYHGWTYGARWHLAIGAVPARGTPLPAGAGPASGRCGGLGRVRVRPA